MTETGTDAPRTVVATRDLTKRYSESIVAVDALGLTIHRGEVYGLLGPNGAGKTTTLRMLLGLVRPTSGSASVLGQDPGAAAGLRGIGALVEEPGLYPYLSGRDNLRVLASVTGASTERVDEVLRTVALTPRADSKVKTYSLGMRQRLGVAAALLKDPELLILDEPTNGLDPQGMAAMRDLIRGLGRGERTVVLSSHLLGEVQEVCDRVGVISGGKLVAEGTVDELRGRTAYVVIAEPIADAVRIAEAHDGVNGVQVTEGAITVDVAPDAVPELNAALVGAGIRVYELRAQQQSLEEAFMALTQS